MKKAKDNPVYGLVAEFDSAEALLAAAGRVREAGYVKTDAFSPIPVHGLADALGARPSRLAMAVLAGGIAGAFAGFMLQYWVSVTAYPHIVSGRPFFSWPSFFPVVFECTVLFAAGTAVVGMLIRNRLPQPYHPVFNTPGFDKASTDGFFLVIEATDPAYDREATRTFLDGLVPVQVTEIMHHPDDEEKA